MNTLGIDGDTPRESVIFDKVIHRTVNTGLERRRYLKHCIIKKHCKPHLSKTQSTVRIIKSEQGLKGVKSHDNIKEFARNILSDIDRRNDIPVEDNWPRHDAAAKHSSTEDGVKLGNISSSDTESLRYSYGLWKLIDQNVLFRFKNHVHEVVGPVGKVTMKI